MKLLRSYGKRTRDDNVATVSVVSPTTIRYGAKFIDLRTAVEKPVRTLDGPYARDGKALRNVAGAFHVAHPDGRSVPLKLQEMAAELPFFVGDALVMQDAQMRNAPFGIFDTNTGEVRGRLEHTPDPAAPVPGMILATVCDGRDNRHFWITDVTSVRCWDTQTGKCVKTLLVPDGHKANALAVTSGGRVVVSIRPNGADGSGDTLIALHASSGEIVARSAINPMSFAWAGDMLAVHDSKNNCMSFLDENLQSRGTAPLPEGEDTLTLESLWSGEREFIAIDWHNRVHHYGDDGLAPAGGATAATPEPKKKAAPKAKKKA